MPDVYPPKATYLITAEQLKDIITQLADEYISTDGAEPPTGGTIVVSVLEGETHKVQLESWHNLVEKMIDIITHNFSPVEE